MPETEDGVADGGAVDGDLGVDDDEVLDPALDRGRAADDDERPGGLVRPEVQVAVDRHERVVVPGAGIRGERHGGHEQERHDERPDHSDDPIHTFPLDPCGLTP